MTKHTAKEAVPLYRRILKDAWHLAWLHKHLWLFGLFATLMSFGSVSEVLFGIYNQTSGASSDSIHFGTLGILPGIAALKGVIAYSPNPILSVLIYISALVVQIGLLAYVVSVSIGGLIYGIRKVTRGGEPTFYDGVQAGVSRAGQVFLTNFIAKAVIAFAFIFTGTNLAVLMSDSTFISNVFYVGSYVVFTVIAVIAAIVAVFATNEVVVDKMSFKSALPKAWHLTKDNWLVASEMLILLTIANLLGAVAALLLAKLISIPLLFSSFIAGVLQSTVLAAMIGAFTKGFMITLIVLIGSFMTTFQVAAWFMLWRELSGKRQVPHIVKVINRLRNKRR